MSAELNPRPIESQWPEEQVVSVPYRVYQDASLFELEQTRIFRGPT